MKSAFSVINLKRSVINTRYKMFMPTYCVYSSTNPIYLNLFPSPFTNRAIPFLLSTFLYFLEKDFFCFIVFTGCFAFNFGLFFSGLIWSTLVLVIFSWSCCSFILQDELVIVLKVSLRRFITLTNF